MKNRKCANGKPVPCSTGRPSRAAATPLFGGLAPGDAPRGVEVLAPRKCLAEVAGERIPGGNRATFAGFSAAGAGVRAGLSLASRRVRRQGFLPIIGFVGRPATAPGGRPARLGGRGAVARRREGGRPGTWRAVRRPSHVWLRCLRLLRNLARGAPTVLAAQVPGDVRSRGAARRRKGAAGRSGAEGRARIRRLLESGDFSRAPGAAWNTAEEARNRERGGIVENAAKAA